MEKSSETAIEIFKINKFLGQAKAIKKAISMNDYKSLKKIYLRSTKLSEGEWSTFMAENKIFQVPDNCDGKNCPYICEKLITPNGINSPEFALDISAGTKKGGFLSQKKEIASLKVRYVESKTAINPGKLSKGMDTSSKISKNLKVTLSKEEKELLTQKVEEDIYRDYEKSDEEDSRRVSHAEEIKRQVK